jgi:hypothetical protein
MLKHSALLELCEEVDSDGRVLFGDEVDRLGQSGGFGMRGGGALRKGSVGLSLAEEETGDEEGDDGMDVS